MVAKSGLRSVKKISELDLDRLYSIEGIRKSTTKYGDKVVVNLEGNIMCYLPARVSKELLSDEEAGLVDFEALLQSTSVSLRRLDGPYNSIEFVVNLPEDAE